MMYQDDLEAAVSAGIIDRRQLVALETLVAERRAVQRPNRDEPFRLLKNFNEVFLTIGVVLVLFGVAGATAYLFGFGGLHRADAGAFYVFPVLLTCWGLAELLTARMRAVAPSIVLAIAFSIAASMLVTLALASKPGSFQGNGGLILGLSNIAGLAAAVLHYARFCLPFSVGLIAVYAIGAVLGLAHWAVPSLSIGALALLCGLAVFAVAVAYDFSDPGRRTRRHQNAFWLHMLAAPLIVHGLFRLITPVAVPGAGGPAAATVWSHLGFSWGGVPALWIVLPIFLVLALLALALDRRAILVASLSYLGAALGATFSKIGSAGLVTALTPLLIGILVLVLGTGWQRIRARLLSVLPLSPVTSRLPPW